MTDEKDLLALARKGDMDAFNHLILDYQNQAFSLAFRIMGEAEAAADATQQAFLSAFRHIGEMRGEAFRPWLLRIVSNACLDEIRRAKRKPAVSVEEIVSQEDETGESDALRILADGAEGPEDSLLRAELRKALERCLQQLAPEMRTTILLADVHAMAYEEVAGTQRIAVGTVKSRVARARADLRACLQKKSGELLPSAYRLKREAQA